MASELPPGHSETINRSYLIPISSLRRRALRQDALLVFMLLLRRKLTGRPYRERGEPVRGELIHQIAKEAR